MQENGRINHGFHGWGKGEGKGLTTKSTKGSKIEKSFFTTETTETTEDAEEERINHGWARIIARDKHGQPSPGATRHPLPMGEGREPGRSKAHPPSPRSGLRRDREGTK